MTFGLSQVTVVVLPLKGYGLFFSECIESILANSPYQIIVTPIVNVARSVHEYQDFPCIAIIGTEITNKRLQMARGLALITTQLTAFTDDDVLWPPSCLHYLLAAFEDQQCGAAGPCQCLIRVSIPDIWHFLGSIYLERRNFEFLATLQLDGGISTLSGRLQVTRTHILQSESFLPEFLQETWMKLIKLDTADDDAFITRYMVNDGWKIKVQ